MSQDKNIPASQLQKSKIQQVGNDLKLQEMSKEFHNQIHQQQQESGILNGDMNDQARLQKIKRYKSTQKMKIASKLLMASIIVLIIFLVILVYRYIKMSQNEQEIKFIDFKQINKMSVQPNKQTKQQKTASSSQNPVPNNKQITNQKQKLPELPVQKPFQKPAQKPVQIPVQKPKQLRSMVPRNVWFFQSRQVNYQQVDQYKNLKYFTSQSNFQLHMVNLQNYKFFLENTKLQLIIEKFKSLPLNRKIKQTYLELVIMLSIIQNNGGLVIGRDLLIRGKLEWMMELSKKHPKLQTFTYLWQNQEKVVEVNYINYFFGSVVENRFIKQLVQKFHPILSRIITKYNPQNNQKSNDRGKSKSKNLIDEHFEVQDVTKVEQFLNATYNRNFNQIIGLNRLILKKINRLDFNIFQYVKLLPLQIQNYGNLYKPPVIEIFQQINFKYLSSYSQNNFQELVGPISRIVYYPQKYYKPFLTQQIKKSNHNIIKNSFFYNNILLQSGSFKPIQYSEQTPFATQWQIPKIIWVYFDQNQQKSILKQYMLNNIIKQTRTNQYEIVVLNKQNMKIFLQQQMASIQMLTLKTKVKKQKQTYKQLIKLNILLKYGGIFIDYPYFLLSNLEWLQKIPLNKFVFNKEGNYPEVFMFHKYLTAQWILTANQFSLYWSTNLQYLTSFIASQKRSSLINDWLNQINYQINAQQSSLIKKLQKQCEINSTDIQNYVLNSLKCAIVKKRNQITAQKQDQPDQLSGLRYYKLWSLDNLFGGEKQNILMSKNKGQCFNQNESRKQFIKSYGQMSYISQFILNGSQQNFKERILRMQEDSIFYSLFRNFDISEKQIKHRQSLNYAQEVLKKLGNLK